MMIISVPTNDATIKKVMESARIICVSKGVKLTQLREHVLRLILLHGKPLGAYAIMDMLEATSDRERVAPPTVYRALDFLLEYRLIHKIHSLNAYLGNTNPRPDHSSVILICAKCGNAEEVPNNTIQQAINLSASQHRFLVEKQVIEITGRCSRCKMQEQEET